MTCFALINGQIEATEKEVFEPIVLGVSATDVNDAPAIPGKGKAPVRIPHIYKSGLTLQLPSSHPEYLLKIIQSDGDVFSSIIPVGVTEFEIPAFLKGECIIQFITSRFCFSGIIILE